MRSCIAISGVWYGVVMRMCCHARYPSVRRRDVLLFLISIGIWCHWITTWCSFWSSLRALLGLDLLGDSSDLIRFMFVGIVFLLDKTTCNITWQSLQLYYVYPSQNHTITTYSAVVSYGYDGFACCDSCDDITTDEMMICITICRSHSYYSRAPICMVDWSDHSIIIRYCHWSRSVRTCISGQEPHQAQHRHVSSASTDQKINYQTTNR